MSYSDLKKKIDNCSASIAVIGLGYVGLPLVIEFVKQGFKVTGIDLSSAKVESLKKHKSYVEDISSEQVKEASATGRFKVFSDYKKTGVQDAVIVCVPTPLRKTGEPDLSYIIGSVDEIVKYVKKDTLIVLESTTYPGTTKEVVLPKFEERGFKPGEDVFIAFSPERVDPGNKTYGIFNTPKVVGGIDSRSLSLSRLLYSKVVEEVVDVDSCEEAEMVKLLENTFRAVNIGLINELAKLCHKFNIDIWNVIRAAATKPYGFMPFYPGPGLGGHCIPIDPQYLSWKARSQQFYPRFIDYAEEVNTSMPNYVVERIKDLLNTEKKCINGSKILLLGVSYKKNVGDLRESPAFDIESLLNNLGAKLFYSDPYVKSFMNLKRISHKNMDCSKYDCVVIITDHDDYDYKEIIDKSKLVMDCRGVSLRTKKKKGVVRI